MKKNILTIIFLILLTLPVLLPLLHTGFFVTDDGEWMIIRFSAFYSAFKDGQIPVRFLHSLNSGYGYPVPTFLYPGFMYFGIPIQIITSNFVDTVKFIFGISLIGSTIFTYLWLNKIFPKVESTIGALISLFIPYHLYDVYTRGSLGEVFALMWVPFILWNIERKSLLFSSIGIAVLILSHNILAFLFLPLIILYMIIKIINNKTKNKKTILQYLSILFLGIGLSSFFIIPALFEIQYSQFSQTKISDPLSYFANLDLIGIGTVFIFLLSLIYIFIKKQKTEHDSIMPKTFFIITILILFFTSPLSANIWRFIPSSFIQFPYRLLSYLIITIPFLTAFAIDVSYKKIKIIFIFFILLAVTISSLQFISPKEYISKDDSYYYTNTATTTVHDEYMPIWVKQKPLTLPENKIEIVKGEGIIQNISYNNKQISFATDLKTNSTIQINTIYWPGWQAFLDNKEIKINYKNSEGVMKINLQKGNHNIRFSFQETPLRLMSDFFSVISLFALIILNRIKKINIL